MTTLKGTDKSPFAKIRRPQEEMPPLTDPQKEYVSNRIKEHQAFRQSPAGKVCFRLCETKKKECIAFLMTPVTELMQRTGLPLDAVNELRAERRGEYLVWYAIQNEMEQFVRELARIEVPDKPKIIHPEEG